MDTKMTAKNVIVAASSMSWRKQVKKGNIATSTKNITNWNYLIDWGLNLKSQETITKWVSDIVSFLWNWNKKVFLTMHAMSMRWISHDYPALLVEALRKQIWAEATVKNDKIKNEIVDIKNKIYSFLISFHGWASETNPKGSHAFYPVRNIKHNMEQSLIESDSEKSKIIDLEIFDSPSSKVLGFTFLWVVWQFIEFIENSADENVLIYKDYLKNFLWDDYDKIMEFLFVYPLSWELKSWQKSMKELWENSKLNPVLNKLSSEVNFAKFSYISWTISDIYLTLAMKYLNDNKENILDLDWDRFLMDWKTIFSWYSKQDHDMDFAQLINKTFYCDLPQKNVSWLFVFDSIDDNTYKCRFNNTLENFQILWSNEKWWHFGVVPLFMFKSLLYDLALVNSDKEFISETKPVSSMYTWDEFIIKKDWNNIKIFNSNNPSEIFADIKISQEFIDRPKLEKAWIMLDGERKSYEENLVPHWRAWFYTFSSPSLPPEPFWLKIHSQASIVEAIWVKLANNFFINAESSTIQNLMETFPKLKDFSHLRWMFTRVKTKYIDPKFEDKINWKNYDLKIIEANWWRIVLNLNVEIIVDWEVILSKQLTFM